LIWIWVGFITFVLFLLALDLGVFNRKAHVVSVREALGWCAVWITLGLCFTVFVYYGYENHWMGLGSTPDLVDRSAQFPEGRVNDGKNAAIKFLTGYVVEWSLSVDNIFVMAMIFGFLAVPRIYQHRCLFWGIMGALVLRGLMIAIGARLVAEFAWTLYIFGAFLIATAVKMLFIEESTDPNETWVVKLTRRFLPITERFHGEHFFVRAGSAAAHEAETPGAKLLDDPAVERAKPGTLMLTPLALALVMVETTDVVFAVDSIPAIFAITADPFLVLTSNVFAILGLRSLYFALAGAIETFRYLKVSLALVLALVGVKMLAHTWLKDRLGPNFNLYLLAVVVTILALGVLASWLHRPAAHPETSPGKLPRGAEGLDVE
jgi:tellurite resistance protein TerC